jgi:hypothetical protein
LLPLCIDAAGALEGGADTRLDLLENCLLGERGDDTGLLEKDEVRVLRRAGGDSETT